jgi:hypothetical protein
MFRVPLAHRFWPLSSPTWLMENVYSSIFQDCENSQHKISTHIYNRNVLCWKSSLCCVGSSTRAWISRPQGTRNIESITHSLTWSIASLRQTTDITPGYIADRSCREEQLDLAGMMPSPTQQCRQWQCVIFRSEVGNHQPCQNAHIVLDKQ